MPPKRDLCRNFQRGSCQYGDRCKFLHSTPQQPKTNPFGFGSQSGSQFQQTNQQQSTNPFGFGVQNKPANQPKPFENTWTRSSPLNNTYNAPTAKAPENKQQAANHVCTDPESCKRVIVEDFEHERPFWKLTCYGHNKNAPCDIVGDISYEELRALAYDEAKQGKSLPLIIDRERNLLNSKLVEFQNLTQRPYVISSLATSSTQNPFSRGISTPSTQNPFSGGISTPSTQNPFSGSITTPSTQNPFSGGISAPSTQNPFSGGISAPSTQNPFSGGISAPSTQNPFSGGISTPSTQNPFSGGIANAHPMNSGVSSPASSFGQLNASLNTSGLPNYTFGQPSVVQNNNSQPTNTFQTNNSPFNTSGPFGSKPLQPAVQSSFPFGTASVSNGANSTQTNPFSNLANMQVQPGNMFGKQQSNLDSSGLNTALSAFGQPSTSLQPIISTPNENTNVDDSVWKKTDWKWNAGEIPEDEPPATAIYIY